jgi:hypothetical protein
VTKLVPKEVEIPVKTLEYAVKETGCKNVFGFNVPCLTEGECTTKSRARICKLLRNPGIDSKVSIR